MQINVQNSKVLILNGLKYSLRLRCRQVLVKVNPEGKYVVDIDKDIDINKCTPNTRVALRNDSYVLHKILPTKVIYCTQKHLSCTRKCINECM